MRFYAGLIVCFLAVLALVAAASVEDKSVDPMMETAMSATTTDGAMSGDGRIRGLVDAVVLRQGQDPLVKIKQYDDDGIGYDERHDCDTDPEDERVVYLYVRDGEPEGEPGDPGYGETGGVVMAAQMVQQAQVAAVSNKWVRVDVDDNDTDDDGHCRLTGISIYRR